MADRDVQGRERLKQLMTEGGLKCPLQKQALSVLIALLHSMTAMAQLMRGRLIVVSE